MATFGIVVGGGPAPGINGVISAATLAARAAGSRVVGCIQGFEWLMQGDIDHVIDLDEEAVNRIHELGGSILRTSRANPTKDPANLDRVIDSLDRLGVDHLISIGGDDTCFRCDDRRARTQSRRSIIFGLSSRRKKSVAAILVTSPAAAWISGAIVPVDGGHLARGLDLPAGED